MPPRNPPQSKPESPIVISYRRVSTTAERQELGLAAQDEAIRAWATKNGKTVARSFVETITGGAPLDKRPILLESIAAVASLHAYGLVVAKLDRFSRDPMTAALAESELRKHGACLICADGTGNGDDPTSELIKGILFSVSKFEKNLIKTRIKAALQVKRSRGERLGAPPYGFRMGDDKKGLVPHPEESAVVAQICALRASGMTIRGVQSAAAERGLLSRTGRPFTLAALHRMLARAHACVRVHVCEGTESIGDEHEDV